MLRIFAALLLLIVAPSVAYAQKRIALLIGNQAYRPGVGALVNPLNDVRLVSTALKSVNFEVLRPVENATRAAILLAVHDFAAKLQAAGPEAVGFLYYSGHGLASEGENYLVPVDIDEASTVLLRVQGVKQSEVLAILRNEAPNAAHYVVLDACRNTLQGARGSKGFVPIRSQSGVLLAFSTEPGKTASDRGQGSGPYAAALAAELVKPGQDDFNMFHNVRIAVIEATRGDQVPWTEDGIQRRQRVKFGGEAKVIPAPPPHRDARISEAAEAWDRTKDTASIAVLDAFIARYKDTYYAELARARAEELRKQSASAAPVGTPPPADKKAGPAGLIITAGSVGPLKLGMTEKEVIALWGKPDERSAANNKPGEPKQFWFFLNYKKKGVSVSFHDGKRANCFFVYSGRRDAYYGEVGYSRYQGAYENGVDMDSRLEDVVSKFGQPDKVAVSVQAKEKRADYQGTQFKFNEPGGELVHIGICLSR